MTPLLDQRQAARLLALSPRTLERLRCVGGGPRFVRIKGSVRYRMEDLQSYIAAHVFANTSQKEAQR